MDVQRTTHSEKLMEADQKWVTEKAAQRVLRVRQIAEDQKVYA